MLECERVVFVSCVFDGKSVSASQPSYVKYLMCKLFQYTMGLCDNKLHCLHHPIIPVSQVDASATWAEKSEFQAKN